MPYKNAAGIAWNDQLYGGFVVELMALIRSMVVV